MGARVDPGPHARWRRGGPPRGLLRYPIGLAPSANPTANMGPDANPVTLGVTDRTEGDDDTTHDAGSVARPIIFEKLDPSHQVAGVDDQVFPFTGDDHDGDGNPGTDRPLIRR